MAIFWERAACLVDHIFSLYFDSVILVISCFSFEGRIWVLIAPVPVIAYLLLFFISLSLFFLLPYYDSYVYLMINLSSALSTLSLISRKPYLITIL